MKLKNSLLLGGIAMASFSVFTFVGCKKSNDSSSANGISATLGTTAFQATIVQGVEPSGDSYIALVGYKIAGGDTLALEIDVSDTATVGYTDVNFNGSSVSYTDLHTGKTLAADGIVGTGAFKLTAWDKTNHKIAGTFSGVLQDPNGSNDSLVVKNGQFNTSYVVTP